MGLVFFVCPQPLKQIQAEGPYTIVGETWGGTIAVELTKMLEGFGDTVNLVLLDGCPSDNQKRLKLLSNVDFEVFRESSEKKVYVTRRPTAVYFYFFVCDPIILMLTFKSTDLIRFETLYTIKVYFNMTILTNQ